MDLTWTFLYQEVELREVGQWSALILSQRDLSVHPPATSRTVESMTSTPITILKVDIVIPVSPTGSPQPVIPWSGLVPLNPSALISATEWRVTTCVVLIEPDLLRLLVRRTGKRNDSVYSCRRNSWRWRGREFKLGWFNRKRNFCSRTSNSVSLIFSTAGKSRAQAFCLNSR